MTIGAKQRVRYPGWGSPQYMKFVTQTTPAVRRVLGCILYTARALGMHTIHQKHASRVLNRHIQGFSVGQGVGIPTEECVGFLEP